MDTIAIIPGSVLIRIIKDADHDGRFLIETSSPNRLPGVSLFGYSPERIKNTFGLTDKQFKDYCHG